LAKGYLDIGSTVNGIGRLDSNTPRKYRKPLVKYDGRAEIICDKRGDSSMIVLCEECVEKLLVMMKPS
jgi:hypothetical protein